MCVHNILCVVCGQWASVNKLERQGEVLIHGITHTNTPCVCVCARVQVTHSHRKCLTITPALLAARSSTTELTPRSSGFFSSRRHLCPGETTLSHPAHSSISLSPPPLSAAATQSGWSYAALLSEEEGQVSPETVFSLLHGTLV